MHGVLHEVRGAFGKLFVFHPPLARWEIGASASLKSFGAERPKKGNGCDRSASPTQNAMLC